MVANWQPQNRHDPGTFGRGFHAPTQSHLRRTYRARERGKNNGRSTTNNLQLTLAALRGQQ